MIGAPGSGGGGHIHASRGGIALLLDSRTGLGNIVCGGISGIPSRIHGGRGTTNRKVSLIRTQALRISQLQEDGGLPECITQHSFGRTKQTCSGHTRRVHHVNNTSDYREDPQGGERTGEQCAQDTEDQGRTKRDCRSAAAGSTVPF